MKCKVCSSETITYNLGKSPLAGYICDYLDESLMQPKFQLELLFCKECRLLYYKEIKEADIYLNKLYSNHLSTFHRDSEFESYLNSFVEKVCERKNINSIHNILEIGCNDGYILNLFRNKKPDINLYGVEPSLQFENIWSERCINIYNDYFNTSASDYFKNLKFDVIYFRHVFEHIFDPLRFFKNIVKLSDANTLIVIEVPYLKSIINNKRIDNLGYSHSNYFTITAINSIINICGFDIIDYEEVNTDGGSIVVYIKKENNSFSKNPNDNISAEAISGFIGHINILKKRYTDALCRFSKDELVGYGAGAKGQHLIHILGLEDIIDKVFDDTPEYNNKFIPGTKIQIFRPLKSSWDKIRTVINLVPTHHKVIKQKIPSNIEFIDFINE